MLPCIIARIADSTTTRPSNINKVRTLNTDPVTVPANKWNMVA
jgi:hypothetical protein